MNPDFIEVVNYVQDLPPQEKRMIYNVYKEFIPKNNKWNKYIKSKTKQPSKELIDHLEIIGNVQVKKQKNIKFVGYHKN